MCVLHNADVTTTTGRYYTNKEDTNTRWRSRRHPNEWKRF
jgi:hypothetical protein